MKENGDFRMILFMVTKEATEPSTGRYRIPVLYPPGDPVISEVNVLFVSWNEVTYQLNDGTSLEIVNLEQLKQAVWDAALKDESACKIMMEQFQKQYGIDISNLWDDTGNPAYHIIGDVFSRWAHPMIGNVVVSAGIRPQTSARQYVKNWQSFPEKYMIQATKDKIKVLIDESMEADPFPGKVSPAGLNKLTTSNRDQVRCCKDMTELARAVIGEITTYATRKLEKIFALELCGSPGLLCAQKELIRCVALTRTETGVGVNPKLKEIFMNYRGNAIKTTEYIYFYFPLLSRLARQIQWEAFIKLINVYLEEEPQIPYESHAKLDDRKLIEECAAAFRGFPAVIRGAMIINAVRKFDKPPNKHRFTLQLVEKPTRFWKVAKAPDSGFVPAITADLTDERGKEFQKSILLWNWTRNETDLSTISYRKCLMPLWGGPSGHSAGLIDFYQGYLGRRTVNVGGKEMPIALIIMPSMFTFWRLYYDKRINAIHTMAETFDAGLARTPAGEDQIFRQINIEAAMADLPLKDEYEDPFELVCGLPYIGAVLPNMTGVIHPLRIMKQIEGKHYHSMPGGIQSIDALDQLIDGLRAGLKRAGFEVPRWAQPINDIDSAATIAESKSNQVFDGFVIRSFHCLNVKVFDQVMQVNGNSGFAFLPFASREDSKLGRLYKKILSFAEAGKIYQFSDDFPDLPTCYIGNKTAPFLSGICFSDLKECIWDESGFTCRAVIRTDADFWESVREIVPVKDTEEIFCMVRQHEEGLRFRGVIGAEAVYQVTEKLSFMVHEVTLESGLDDVTGFPCICAAAEIVADTDGGEHFDLTVVISPGGGRLYIEGEYAGGKVLTIAGLLSLFGLDEGVRCSELLPDQESVFGSLGLRSVTLTVDTESEGITQAGFTVTAEKPWNIFGNKITLQPYFEMNIEYPFESGKRKVDYSVLGKWHIGSTVFDLMYRSDQTIYACLADDSILNFADVAELFAKDICFPAIKLTGMELNADVASGSYSLYLSAEQVLEFEVGKAKLGIESLSFHLDFAEGRFGELKLGGVLALGGITLALHGSYCKDTGLTFEAMAYSEEDYSLGDFIALSAQGFGQTFDRSSLPGSLLAVKIRMLTVSYQSGEKAFHGYVDLENVLVVSDDFAITEIALEISSRQGEAVAFCIIARIHVGGADVYLSVSKEKGGFILAGEAEFGDLTFGKIAAELGIGTGHLPDCISEFAVTKLGVNYNFTTRKFALDITTDAGRISAEISAGEQSGWAVAYEADPKISVDLLQMPLVGELVQKVTSAAPDLSVKDFVLAASSAEGVVFRCTALGSACTVELYKPAPHDTVIQRKADQIEEICQYKGCEPGQQAGNSNGIGTVPETVKWIKLNKTISILTVSKAGIGLDGSRVVLLLDASLALSPFTFSLAEAGAGINLSKLSDAAFYLSGFGVSFDNGALAVSGSFSRKQRAGKEVYAGSLLVKCKAVTAMAVGEYSSGSLFAYMALSAAIGGPPAFFVTGLALGFGYNKKLTLPSVEKVPEYPLIKAVQKGFDAHTLDELNRYITEEGRQNFLTAGVRFTSFKIVDGFLLLSVSFGKKFQIGVLGTADISMPPHAPSNPVAKAQLALRAEYDPSAGVFCAEAWLTSESYILSRDCKLTGGFAAFFWFDGSEHSGDFVITLGGYHPAFQKPDHYPEVPRLGLNWNINSHLNISGEMYFALTPGAVMAGGKLSAVYTLGKLRAWFIAWADFIVSWKPFYYRAEIGVSLGASYRVDGWFIHKTFSIELAAKLALWGPEVQGRLHVSWFIISFTISFSKGADHSGETLDWEKFKESFLLDDAQNRRMKMNRQSVEGSRGDTDILAVTVTGIAGQTPDGTDIITPNGFGITLVSRIPEQGNVRPVNSAELKSKIVLTVEDEKKSNMNDRFRQSSVTKNVPAALWKSAPDQKDRLREESLLKDARCGTTYELQSEVREQELFPKSRFISMEELYRNNTLVYDDCFRFVSEQQMKLSDEDSIHRFAQSADSAETKKRRQQYLAENGITEPVSIPVFAGEVENWLAEELLIRT